MKITHQQEIKLRQISDGKLYDNAVSFIEKNGTITNTQIAGIENIANTASCFSDIDKFIKHQAEKKQNEKISKFYIKLKTEVEQLKVG